MSAPHEADPMVFEPRIVVADTACAFWLAQVTWRLRRELSWCWHQRSGGAAPVPGALPPFGDPVQESLDLQRFHDDKLTFFATDPTARYLAERIAALQPPGEGRLVRGSWGWIADQLALSPAAQFVLACALAARADAAVGSVCAACHNDASRPWPSAALAQRLWDEPLAVVACADAGHALFRYGLLAAPAGRDTLEWHQPLEVPAAVANALLDQGPRIGAGFDGTPLAAEAQALVVRLRVARSAGMQVVPLQGTTGSDFEGWARTIAWGTGHGLEVLRADLPAERPALAALATVCWLRGEDVLLPEHWQERCCSEAATNVFAGVAALPVRWFLPVLDRAAIKGLPAASLMPAFTVPVLTVPARAARLAAALRADCSAEVRAAVPEAARRFRLAERSVERAADVAATLGAQARPHDLFAICRAESRVDLDTLANAVAPRFRLDELVLPESQSRQLAEIAAAMRALGRVHYEWGTAQAWNESGLSVLFCGPPGTGKTMAAEALAAELDLPMYRIDLSQVVNKYIGETEKNLRRIFDAAEASDCVLFFDEADALFGKRTEVKDAHDRFANIEVSYLLERMERAKGLAILASNRRKDLDDAFTRRLRYIVEFPLPGGRERERIWRQVFPPAVDTAGVDYPWLAERFELAGGHIRSAAFNACLQAAAQQGASDPARVGMADLLLAVKRELQKMNRVAGPEQFGRYARLVKES